MKQSTQLKKQIKGFQEVSETVKAIEKIAASNLRLLKDKTENLKQYKESLFQILINLTSYNPSLIDSLKKENKNSNLNILVIIGSNKGLMGGLNKQIIRKYRENQSKYNQLFVIGKRIQKLLIEKKVDFIKLDPFKSKIPQDQEIDDFYSYLFDLFKQKKAAKLEILYLEYSSVFKQQAILTRLFPFQFYEVDAAQLGLPIISPNSKKIFKFLISEYTDVLLREIIYSAKTSEYTARTISSEHANIVTTNLIKNLKLQFFKLRSKDLTQKQIESYLVNKLNSST